MTPEQTYKAQLPLINSIIYGCEKRIKDSTDLEIKLVHEPVVDPPQTQDDFAVQLINDCCRCWGTESSYIIKKTRKTPIVDMRQLATYVLFKAFPKMSLKRIGQFFNQDHTTVISSVVTIKERISANDELTMKLYSKIKHLLPHEKVQG